MLKFFKKWHKNKQPSLEQPVIQSNLQNEWHTPLTAETLLQTPLRQQYLTQIWQNVSMSPQMFEQLYLKPIHRYIEMVQLIPASESHHHAHLGGMIDHGLEVIAIASKLRQSYILPQNAAPEDQARQRDVWTAVTIYAALVHDIGKVATDIEIVLFDGSRWFPWQGMPNQPYKFRYIKQRDYHLHPTLGGFFVTHLISQEALNWIAPFSEAFSQLMYFAANHTDKAGILGEIIQKADQYSVTMALGGEISKLSEKPKISFAKQLHMALQKVIEGYKLNTLKGGGQGWLSEEGLWVLAKTTVDSIRAYLAGQGISAPSKNGAMFDELMAHRLIEATPENTAIWNIKVNSAVWDGASLSVLKIRPSVIWEDVHSRPAIYEGNVFLTDKNGNVIPMKTEVDSIQENPVNNQEHNETQTNKTEEENKHIITENIHSENQENANYEENNFIQDSSNDFNVDNLLNLFDETAITSETEEKEEEKRLNTETENKIKTETGLNQNQQNKTKTETEPNHPEMNQFINWVRAGVLSRKILINQPEAKLHFVENHLFMVTPSIFQIYCAEVIGNTDKETWEELQKQFQKLSLHKRQQIDNGDSQNIWTCKIVGPNRSSKLNGYLIEDVKPFVGDKLVINNQWLTLLGKTQ